MPLKAFITWTKCIRTEVIYSGLGSELGTIAQTDVQGVLDPFLRQSCTVIPLFVFEENVMVNK